MPDPSGRNIHLPPEAVEAAAKGMAAKFGPDAWDALAPYERALWMQDAERALSAALPHLRAWIANEIEAEAKPLDMSENSDTTLMIRAVRESTLSLAARVARGDQNHDRLAT